MGVDIGGLFTKEKITFQDLHDRIILIDAYNVMHQFLSSIRQRDGTPLKDAEGNITSHLSGLFQRTANMVEARIKPVYVFDGIPHPLKEKTLALRKQRKEKAEKEWQEALKQGDLKKAKTKAQQTSRVTEEIVNQSKTLLEALGIPHVQAPQEGEAQACYMVKKGDAYAVGSQDFDCLLVGTPILIRNLTSSSRRKLPGKNAYASVHPKMIRLHQNLERLSISHKQLVDLAILVGTDFNQGVHGIGPKRGLDLIKKNGNIENVIAKIGGESAPTFDEINMVRSLFLQPKVTDEYSLHWSKPDERQVLEILCEQHQFTRNRVESTLEKYASIEQMIHQKTLF